MMERAAARLVRLPLRIAPAIAGALVLEAVGLPGALAAARIGVAVLLATYLLAGLLNLPRFPRTLRGPPTAVAADRILLDMWSCLALFAATLAVARLA